MAHHEEIFAVNSQVELLNAILMHAQSTSQFITVEGNKGSGKTWLSQHFLMLEDNENISKALLLSLKNQTPEQQRDIIIGQLLPKCIIEDDTIIDNILSYREEEEFNAVVVIDDAEAIQPEILDELAQTIIHAQTKNHWVISVVLFTQMDASDELLSNVDIRPESTYLNIDPFTDQEKEEFVEAIVIPVIDEDGNKDKARAALPSTPPYPANLIKLIKKYNREPLFWVRPFLIGVLVLVVMIGWITSWVGYFTSEPQESNVQVEESLTINTSSSQVGDAEDELPKMIGGATNKEPSTPPKKQTKPLPRPSKQTETASKTETVEKAEKAEKAEKPTSTANKTAQWDNNKLLALSPNQYTLQLAAFGSGKNAQQFISKYKLGANGRIHTTKRGDRMFYIVTYKEFSSTRNAQAEISKLPKDIQSQKPWARSVRSIQQDIKQ